MLANPLHVMGGGEAWFVTSKIITVHNVVQEHPTLRTKGTTEHSTMTMNNFIRKIDEEFVVIYVEFLEQTKTHQHKLNPKHRITNTKMFRTEDENCPVSSL